jgi:hypothetical protein
MDKECRKKARRNNSMVLMKKIESSSIAEVVIALAIIAMCFTIGSLVFIRSVSSSMKFMDFGEQTKLQSDMMVHMIENERDLTYETGESLNDSIVVYEFISGDNKLIWRQEWLKELK